jgi:pimeloyl-ACP methyl ester carboxylesterase
MILSVNQRPAYAYNGGKAFDPALPCITFVHGAMGDHTVWTLLARWAAHHGHAVLALDLPGHMQSAGPALARIEDMADWLWALLDAAGVRRSVLVGHSMGSLVALRAAATQAERARGLVMVGTAVPMPVPQALRDLSLSDVGAAIERVVGFSFSTLAAKPSYPGPGTWLRGGARSLMHLVQRRALAAGEPRLFHTDFSACNDYGSGLDDAAKVQCPATLVLGRADQMTLPRGAQAVASALRAEVHTLQAGHFPMQEAPDAMLNALRAALARCRTEHSAGA